MSTRVLVVDDERQILRALRVVLSREGFTVATAERARGGAGHGRDRPARRGHRRPGAPDGDGVEVCAGIREWSQMPILVLSAVGDESEKIRALNAGADDYVTKPFAPGELVARLNATLRRGGPAARSRRRWSAWTAWRWTWPRRMVRRDGERVHLTPTEFELLRMLVRQRGRLLTHRMLLGEVWGPSYEEDAQVLRVHIANLRRKLEPDTARPRYITTDPGVGYRFSA